MTRGVVSVKPTNTLADVRRELREHRIHHLIVLDGELAVGVVSYRDLMNRPESELVSAVMSRDVPAIEPWDTVKEAAAMMLGRTHGCLPVIESGRVTGIITTTDLLRGLTARAVGG